MSAQSGPTGLGELGPNGLGEGCIRAVPWLLWLTMHPSGAQGYRPQRRSLPHRLTGVFSRDQGHD
jgi:hypothetical protein